MELACPTCGRAIVPDDVNVARDVAFCRACNEAFALSEMLQDEQGQAVHVDPSRPPKGVNVEESHDSFSITATTRHPMAFFLVPFMCVWSGFSLGGIYGSQIISGEFNLFMSLFGLPFLAGTILFGSLAVMAVCGKVRVRVQGDQGEVFTGVGPLGRRKRFNWYAVKAVNEIVSNTRYPNNPGGQCIALDGAKRVKFGSLLSTERRYFVMGVLKQMLAARV